MVDPSPLAFRAVRRQRLGKDRLHGAGLALDPGGQRIAAQRAEADAADRRVLAGTKAHSLVVHEDESALALHHRSLLGEVERDDRDVFGGDVAPYVALGPVGERRDPERLARLDAGVVEVPDLGTLRSGFPPVVRGPQREDPFLGPRAFLVPAGAAEDDVVAAGIERLAEGLGLHDVGVVGGPVVEGVDPAPESLVVGVDAHIKAEFRRRPVPEGDHLPELPGGVDVQEREGDRRWPEGLAGQVEQHRGVLADGIEHDRPLRRRHPLAQDLDGLGLKGSEDRAVVRPGSAGRHDAARCTNGNATGWSRHIRLWTAPDSKRGARSPEDGGSRGLATHSAASCLSLAAGRNTQVIDRATLRVSESTTSCRFPLPTARVSNGRQE